MTSHSVVCTCKLSHFILNSQYQAIINLDAATGENSLNVAAGCCCCWTCPNTDVPPPNILAAAGGWLAVAPNRPVEAGWALNEAVVPKPVLAGATHCHVHNN